MSSSMTRPWRETDSNFEFPATVSSVKTLDTIRSFFPRRERTLHPAFSARRGITPNRGRSCVQI